MRVSEFCKKYNVSHQTVYTKIRRKKKQLKGHISKKGVMELDDYAVELLQPDRTVEKLRDRVGELYREKVAIGRSLSEQESRNEQLYREKKKEIYDIKSEYSHDKQEMLAAHKSEIESLRSAADSAAADYEQRIKTLEETLEETLSEKEKLLNSARETEQELRQQINLLSDEITLKEQEIADLKEELSRGFFDKLFGKGKNMQSVAKKSGQG